MDYPERERIRTAAHHAKKLYPGVVGELINRELEAFLEFGYRTFQGGSVPLRLTEHILTQVEPQ
jgi:hypothetical protein